MLKCYEEDRLEVKEETLYPISYSLDFWCTRIKRRARKKHKHEIKVKWMLLGVVFLYSGWYGFNAGSTWGLTDASYKSAGTIVANLTMTSSFATLWMLIYKYFIKDSEISVFGIKIFCKWEKNGGICCNNRGKENGGHTIHPDGLFIL